MARKYTRKQIGSVASLNREQERIARTCRDLENDMFNSLLNPQNLAISVATGLISRITNKNTPKKQKKSSSIKLVRTEGPSAKIAAENNASSKIATTVKNIVAAASFQSLIKRTAKSWLRWQAFNLAWYFGKKAFNAIKQRRAETKLHQPVADLHRRGKRS
jgi:hypothetical protein